MSLRVVKYIKELRKKAKELEGKDINNKKSSLLARNQRWIICSIPSFVLLCFLKEGFPSDFVSYMSSALSILIGLFTTAIIFGFDKFYQKEDLTTANSTEKLINTQSYNYTKQFVYITGYSIVLCVCTLVFLSFSSLFETAMGINVWKYRFDFENIDWHSTLNFLLVVFVILQRFFVLYWMANIVYNTLFAVGSLVKHMTLKMDR